MIFNDSKLIIKLEKSHVISLLLYIISTMSFAEKNINGNGEQDFFLLSEKEICRCPSHRWYTHGM